MPQPINRSPLLVSVAGSRKLDKQFSINRRADAQTYALELAAGGKKAVVRQLETAYQVRITGHERTRRTFATFASLAAAQDFCAVAAGDRARGLYVDYTAAQKVLLKTLIAQYLEERLRRRNSRSYETAKYRLERICRDHEDLVCTPFGALLPGHFNAYVEARLDDDIAASTVDRELDDLRAVINFAIKTKRLHVAQTPWDGVCRPVYYNERDRRLRPGEEERLLATAAADESPYLAPIILIAIHTAMRRGEILALRLEWIDLEKRCVRLPSEATKNARPRAVPLTSIALETLLAQPPTADGRIFPVTGNCVRKGFFDRVIPRSGIVDLHFHDLRHEAISRYAESGRFTLLDLAQISGHRDLRMLQRYAHLCTVILAERMDAVQPSKTIARQSVHKGRVRTVLTVIDGGRPARPASPAVRCL